MVMGAKLVWPSRGALDPLHRRPTAVLIWVDVQRRMHNAGIAVRDFSTANDEALVFIGEGTMAFCRTPHVS